MEHIGIDIGGTGIKGAPVDIATKGYWGMGIVLLMASLVNFVKYRMDQRIQQDVVRQIEAAKNEKILKEYVSNT